MVRKRVTSFAGHYGSGKTHLAVNLALSLREEGKSVVLADLDIVNPYYRTNDAQDLLTQNGIVLIASEYAGSNAELPSLPPSAARVFDDKTLTAVLDVGGDDRGALALGRFARPLSDVQDADMLMVVNFRRPLTTSPEEALAVLHEIEIASHVRFTGIVNNTNLGHDTTIDLILRSHENALKLCEIAGLPLCFTSAREDLLDGLHELGELFPLRVLLH